MEMKKHLIKNSTKEERKKRVKESVAISMLDAKEPSEYAKENYNEYINGNMELDEVLRKVIKKHKAN